VKSKRVTFLLYYLLAIIYYFSSPFAICCLFFALCLLPSPRRSAHARIKKTQKTPKTEIDKVLAHKKDYLDNGGWKR